MTSYNIESIRCPMCDKGIIQIVHIPSVRSHKYAYNSSVGRKSSYHNSKPDFFVYQGKSCLSCGATDKEIEKKATEMGIYA